jgi:transposase
LFPNKAFATLKPQTYKSLFPAQIRQQMIELVQAGCRPRELAKAFNYHATSSLTWVRQSSSGVPLAVPPNVQGQALSSAERQERIELRRKLRQVQMERDILAQAAA